jgi:D-serine deaminase-like pyridoxal phosphate-dependent protein
MRKRIHASGGHSPYFFPVVARNATVMLDRAHRLGVSLRPHVKTHKTIEGALLQTCGSRTNGIVVSTLGEAIFFANNGFQDIVYAVPITPDKLADAAALTVQITSFYIMIDSQYSLDQVCAHPMPSASKPWNIILAFDCGYHRDGVDIDDPASIKMAKQIVENPMLAFGGIYTHGGHSYGCSTAAGIETISRAERDAAVAFAKTLKENAINCPIVGIGSTPTCSVPPSDGLSGVTEMHPGNYLMYDAMQTKIGSCSRDDIAIRILARVIGHYPRLNMMLLDMGWTAISDQGGSHGYGFIVGHPDLKIKVLKQEAAEVFFSFF